MRRASTCASQGKGLDGLKAPRRTLDAENSGSTMRMLAGVLAGQTFQFDDYGR